MSDTTTKEQAELVAYCVSDLLLRLHREQGIPLPVLLAAAHGELVTVMASIVGGEMAAERCENAARHVRDLPSADAALAATPARGTA